MCNQTTVVSHPFAFLYLCENLAKRASHGLCGRWQSVPFMVVIEKILRRKGGMKMAVIDSEKIFYIMKNTFNRIDDRLVDHGQRVSELVIKTLEDRGGYSQKELRDIAVICYLHDIGAYKTEEIDQILSFETEEVHEHSLYGYLFLKYFSSLEEFAKIVLYHHVPWKFIDRYEPEYQYMEVAQLLYLADRIDIYVQLSHNTNIYLMLEKFRGKLVKSEIIDWFLETDEKHHIMEQVYIKKEEWLPKQLKTEPFTEEEIDSYLRLISYAIDFRSQYMVSHTITTTRFSCELAKLCGCSKEEEKLIRYGALLHDVGKVAIPNRILDYPGKLSKVDMDTMRTHVDHSIEILKGVISDDVMEIAVRHHEKLNGSGYPRGLTEEELTIPQRIVAIADILSALVGKRSYKEEFDDETIAKILREMVGRHEIDGKIVEIAIAHMSELRKKVKKQCEPILQKYYHLWEEYENNIDRFQQKKNNFIDARVDL